MNVLFNDLYSQYMGIKGELDGAIASVIKRSAFIEGDDVDAFETQFASFCGGGFCAGVSNGTDALTLALKVLGIGAGDEVILPAMTFIATIESVLACGANPVLVDVDERSFTLDVSATAAAITDRTRAIVAVHLYGHPAEMEGLSGLCKRHGLVLVEDAAQAHGASVGNRRAGLLGDAAAFSFFPGKNIGAFGDAGAVVSREAKLIDRIRALRNHGRRKGDKFGHQNIGQNARLDNLQAAILQVKLKHLESWNERRRQIAANYLLGLAETSLVLPMMKPGTDHAFHLFVVLSDDRDRLQKSLRASNIASGQHYPQALHEHEAVKTILGDQSGKFPVAERIARQCLSLPIYPGLTNDQVNYVIEVLQQHCGD